MNHRNILLMVLFTVMICGAFAITEASEESDADEMVTVHFYSSEGGSIKIYFMGSTGTPDYTITSYTSDDISLIKNHTYTLVASPDTNYTFDYWYFIPVSIGTSTTNPYTISFTDETYVNAYWDTSGSGSSSYIVRVEPFPSGYGTVTPTGGYNIPAGTTAVVSMNTLTLDVTTWRVTPTPSNAQYSYAFTGFSINNGDTIDRNMTIDARFSRFVNSYTVTIGASSGGSVSSSSLTVPYGSTYTTNGNVLTFTIQGNNGSYQSSITATPDQYYSFVSWSSDSGTVTSATSITASFTQQTNTLHLTSYDGGTAKLYHNSVSGSPVVSVSSGTYQDVPILLGDTYYLVGTPDTGNSFYYWYFAPVSLGTSTDNPKQIVFTGETYASAYWNRDYYTVTVGVFPDGSGTVTNAGAHTVPSSSTISINGNVMTIGQYTFTATANTSDPQYEFTFDRWGATNGAQVDRDMQIDANFTRTVKSYTVTIEAGAGGDVSESSLTVNYGTTFSNNGNVLTFNIQGNNGSYTRTVTATPDDGFAFKKWSINTGTVTTNMTITATFKEQGNTDILYWSNEMHNGSVSVLFKFPSGSSVTHVMEMPLYSGTVNSVQETTWNDSGYSLIVSASYISGHSSVTATLMNGTTVMETGTKTIGNWYSFMVRMDTSQGVVTLLPVKVFNDFTSYEIMDSMVSEIVSWNAPINTTIYEIQHTDTGTGAHPYFSVVNTSTFLNTFGVVLTDPSINIYSYFPQYETVRVNLFAFAVYGDTMTINGKTWDVVDSKVTIYYTEETWGNEYATENTQQAKSKTLTLSNIYVTWDGTYCTLTFDSENFSVRLGTYSNGSETLSFTGLWYFTASIYEPYTATQTQITGDWGNLMDIDKTALLLVFLGIILIAGLIAHMKLGLKWIDMSIVVIAMIVALALLG